MDCYKFELSDLKSSKDIVKTKETKLRNNSIINIACLWVINPSFNGKDDFTSSMYNIIENQKFNSRFGWWNLNLKNIGKEKDVRVYEHNLDESFNSNDKGDLNNGDNEAEKELEETLILSLNFRFHVLECIWQAYIFNEKNLRTDDFEFKEKDPPPPSPVRVGYRKRTGGFGPSDVAIENSYFQKMKYQRSFIEDSTTPLLGKSNSIKIISYISIKISNSLNLRYNLKRALPLHDIIKNIETIDNSRQTNKDFKNIINDKKYSDCVLKIEEKEIYVHKVILASKSKVFNNMFIGDLSKYEINNISYDNLMRLLNYIYSGEIENLNAENALLLLPETDKYKIDDLKLKCESILLKSINLKNSIDILLISDSYNTRLLKNASISFIVKNIKKYKTNDFQRIADKNPNLLVQILSKNTSD